MFVMQTLRHNPFAGQSCNKILTMQSLQCEAGVVRTSIAKPVAMRPMKDGFHLVSPRTRRGRELGYCLHQEPNGNAPIGACVTPSPYGANGGGTKAEVNPEEQNRS